MKKKFYIGPYEIEKSINMKSKMDNGKHPRINTYCVARQRIKKGSIIRGTGYNEVRAVARYISKSDQLVPSALCRDSIATENIEAGSMITFDQIEMSDNHLCNVWKRHNEM
jgi:predicted homoserine dehydrogenase-like protein